MSAFAPKNIVVPVDVDALADRSLAEQLVDAAADLAKIWNAKLTLLHVASPMMSPGLIAPETTAESYRAMVEVVEARNASAHRILDELVGRARDKGVAAPRAVMTTNAGSVPELIVAAAKDQHADLIAMTTHARRGLARFFLGSVAERTAHLADKSHMAVLLLPATAS